jgi:hypothetical protein
VSITHNEKICVAPTGGNTDVCLSSLRVSLYPGVPVEVEEIVRTHGLIIEGAGEHVVCMLPHQYAEDAQWIIKAHVGAIDVEDVCDSRGSEKWRGGTP